MIAHIVMWRLTDDCDDRDAALSRMAEALRSLPGRIPEIRTFEVGFPNVSPGPAGFDISLYSRFDSMEALEAYRVHPEHQKVAELIQSLTSERAVVDYEA